MGQAKSRWYIINGLLMLASFALFRNVLGVGGGRAACSMIFFCVAFLVAEYIVSQYGHAEFGFTQQ